MNHIDNFANISLRLDRSGPDSRHTDSILAERVNFWRDLFPESVRDFLLNADEGQEARFSFGPGELIPAPSDHRRHSLWRRQIIPRDRAGKNGTGSVITPRTGRFYPKGRFAAGLSGVLPQNIAPIRVTDAGENQPNDKLDLDENHPLSGRELELTVRLNSLSPKESDTGGNLVDWAERITDGPGMESRHNGNPTDFFADDPFARPDDDPDDRFYGQPRMVAHLDDRASETVRKIAGEFVSDGMKVLDLMSSWVTWMPEDVRPAAIDGLGMNADELAANPRLANRIVHDLNLNPRLPFGDETYDAVLCNVSVEYLVHPVDVFADVARALKPGGSFLVTFSNRWFPPKAIRIWTELHEFERMGLVMEYFHRSKAFFQLGTRTDRGRPRPETDRHYGETVDSDPVYAVWGRRR